MGKILYLDEKESFGIEIEESKINAIYHMCKESFPKETGGIIIGKYSSNLNRAEVKIVTGAPVDSKCGRTWFHRGTKGLQELLDEAWDKKGMYYLGEWHYHPGGTPSPSIHDIVEMNKISKNNAYHCPEPILLIAVGSPINNWTLGAFIFTANKKQITLKQQNE
ncbi:Mov34/MPN/PAD-1 family protein [Neobacillus sp. YIM B06451]|uniref:Mov34/MPN/PAD-1 family protein n=1 Tax=Neobacillus sp. YIM B06451 TaxID=3070994 RepID=UPI00292E5D52|nr:Mov34/MPN/PAD-1 family protein [Neobacillus sp. YIM B06451]